MAQFEDFYEFLGIEENASSGEIEAVIQAQRKIWIKRQNSADAAKQIEAQTRVTKLDRAAMVLLKDASRSKYDRQLAQARAESTRQPAYSEAGHGGSEQPAPPSYTGPGPDELIQRAFEYYQDDAGPHVVLQTLDQAKALAFPTASAWVLRGFMQEQLNEDTQAEISYREALTQDPANVQALINLSSMESLRGQHDRARERAMEATRLDPENPQAHLNLAWAFLNADQPQEATRYLKPIIDAHPELDLLRQIHARAVYYDTLNHMTQYGESYFFTSRAQIKYAKEHLPAALLAAAGNPDLEKAIAGTMAGAQKASLPKVVNFRRHWWKLLLLFLVIVFIFDGLAVLIVLCAVFAALCVRSSTGLTSRDLMRQQKAGKVIWGIK